MGEGILGEPPREKIVRTGEDMGEDDDLCICIGDAGAGLALRLRVLLGGGPLEMLRRASRGAGDHIMLGDALCGGGGCCC